MNVCAASSITIPEFDKRKTFASSGCSLSNRLNNGTWSLLSLNGWRADDRTLSTGSRPLSSRLSSSLSPGLKPRVFVPRNSPSLVRSRSWPGNNCTTSASILATLFSSLSRWVALASCEYCVPVSLEPFISMLAIVVLSGQQAAVLPGL